MVDATFTTFGQAIAATFGTLLIAAYPLMRLVRMWSSDRKDNAKDGAESVLYTHLSNQVQTLNEELTKFRNENATLLVEISALRGKISHFEDVFTMNTRLKLKLDARELENTRLRIVIEELKSHMQSVCVFVDCSTRIKKVVNDLDAVSKSADDGI